MLKNKQNKDVANKQEVTYTELKFPKSQQKQRIPKTDQSNVISSEEQVKFMELKFTSSHLQHERRFARKKRKVFFTREEQNQKIALIPSLPSKNGECSCDLCSSHWIGFGNSCYHHSSELKTWPESHAACAKLNSHLLKIDINEELEILSIFQMKGWIGLKINETNGFWLWEDGIKGIQSVLKFLKGDNHSCAYIEGKYVYADDCSSRKSYVCEFSI
ncbi:killer cell lectin-like receptor subfamily I member 1 isoform X2 [Equus asinus]|uniref:killer cell lectin-like receptor subfamily I member 1 n=1 Tax=Equus quagga TaxID=89248 RepID=UPI001D0515F4|nr:killer cell lectin-like receptor subfamily I member 1 [Equus asinus]XP_046522999.1 killer cell lectin-like receptor subfamily I member 1 [Equus quagga]